MLSVPALVVVFFFSGPLGARLILTVNRLLRDSMEGSAYKLGFLFLFDLLLAQPHMHCFVSETEAETDGADSREERKAVGYDETKKKDEKAPVSAASDSDAELVTQEATSTSTSEAEKDAVAAAAAAAAAATGAGAKRQEQEDDQTAATDSDSGAPAAPAVGTAASTTTTAEAAAAAAADTEAVIVPPAGFLSNAEATARVRGCGPSLARILTQVTPA